MEGFVQAVAGGAWPLWNPLPGFGQPMLGDPDYMVAYPLTWLNLILPPWIYYTVFVVLHLFWTALGTYLLLRLWRGSRAAAYTGAALWTLSGPMISLVSLWHHFASACWAPWVFLAAERALISRRWQRAGLWALASGLQILAGSADVVAMTLLALALHTAFLRIRWRRLLGRGNRRLVAIAAGALLLALGLAAVQIGAVLEVVRHSPRWSHAQDTRTYWSVHPVSLLDAVVPPMWMGLPLHPFLLARLFESREPFLTTLYLGVGTLPLAGAALARRGRRSLVLGLIALGAALVSLGRFAPFYGILIALVPPLQILRYPVKAWIIVGFLWALLCAHGVDALRSARPVPRRPWVSLVLAPLLLAAVAMLAAAAFAWRRPMIVMEMVMKPGGEHDEVVQLLTPVIGRLCVGGLVALTALALAIAHLRRPDLRPVLAAALAALAVADLGFVLRNMVDVADRLLYVRPPVVDLLREQKAERVYAYDYYSSLRARALLDPEGAPELVRRPPGWSDATAYALVQQMHLTPSSAGRWKLASGYERDLHGLAPPDLTQLVLLLPELEKTPVHQLFLRLAGVTHVVALHDSSFADLRPVGTVPSLYAQPVRVFAVPRPLPRAYVVAGARPAEGRLAFATMMAPDFDPEREVVLSYGAASPAPPQPAGTTGTAVITERRADRVRLRAEMAREGYLVILEGYDPAWKVSVDGRPAPVLRANIAFLAVRLPPGSHEVDARYRPRGAIVGFFITLASAAACAVLVSRRRA